MDLSVTVISSRENTVNPNNLLSEENLEGVDSFVYLNNMG